MRLRLLVVPLCLCALSCKQACGLDEAGGSGGGGTTSSSTGGGGGGAGAGTMTSTGSTTSTGSSMSSGVGGASCEGGGPTGTLHCHDDFDGPLQTCLSEDDCGSGMGGGSAGDACGGSWTLDGVNGLLIATPDPNTGFWDTTESMFIHTGSVEGPFVAHTIVRPRSASGAWPVPEFQLAGLVAREGSDLASVSTNWFKAEIGTIAGGARGFRTARKIEMGFPDANPQRVGDATEGIPTSGDPGQFQIVVCRDSTDVMHAYYRETFTVEGWVPVEPVDNPALAGNVQVGIVAANAGPDANGAIVADFGFLHVETLNGTISEQDCRSWAESNCL